MVEKKGGKRWHLIKDKMLSFLFFISMFNFGHVEMYLTV